jgi:hypothetical protein
MNTRADLAYHQKNLFFLKPGSLLYIFRVPPWLSVIFSFLGKLDQSCEWPDGMIRFM